MNDGPDDLEVTPVDPERRTDDEGHPIPTLYEALFAPCVSVFGITRIIGLAVLAARIPSFWPFLLVGTGFVAFTDYFLARHEKKKWLVQYRDRLLSVATAVTLDAYLDGVKTGRELAESLEVARVATKSDATDMHGD